MTADGTAEHGRVLNWELSNLLPFFIGERCRTAASIRDAAFAHHSLVAAGGSATLSNVQRR